MNKNKGQILPIVIAVMLFLMIIIPTFVKWVQNEAKWSVKQHRSTTAFNLAEAGIDRGVWKLKSSTGTWQMASRGIVISRYNFDVSFNDVEGGLYRVKFSSGPSTRQVTIVAEGKDTNNPNFPEVRSIKAIYTNQTIPGAVIAKGIITWANAFSAHWGPIMAHGKINITDANAAKEYFPRKFSRQTVESNQSGYARDTSGLSPPNTDGLEWWSDYDVPELPMLDFTALRSSAAATGTLNVFGCSKMSSYKGTKWWGSNLCKGDTAAGSNHDGLPHCQNLDKSTSSKKGYTWYWDNDVKLTGSTADEGCGVNGNIIVRGKLTNYCGDNYYYTGHVPDEAWKEYAKITKTVGDTSTTNQYPADNGYRKNRSTFKFGGETWSPPTGISAPSSGNTDIGVKGFMYVGGDYDIQGPMDINGAIWAVGNVSKATGAERTVIYFDDSLDLPSLNVVLVRNYWEEIMPSNVTWVAP